MTPSTSPKRRKITRACDSCRAQKKRCTGTVPCDSCVRNSKKCTFLASYTRGRAITPPPSTASAATPATPSSSCTRTFNSATSPVGALKALRPPSRSATNVVNDRSFSSKRSYPVSSNGRAWDTLRTQSELPSVVPQQDQASEPASDEVLPDGNFVGPGSAHSWLKQAWSCLGRVRQHVVRLHSTQIGTAPSTRFDGPIFSHGDRALMEDHVENMGLPHFSADTLDLLISTYFDRGLATYRFLHRPTVTTWLHDLQSHKNGVEFPPVRWAIVLLLLAVGSSYMSEKERAQLPEAEAAILRNEDLFYQALKRLREEKGAPSVESVQARLMQVHYLLTSSRPNKAWYAFGTVVQLVFALGLHQRGYARQNVPGLERESRRRAFWGVYKTDKSLSIALGRPSLMREECITQDMPEIVNDDQIFDDHIAVESDDDCLMIADVLQVRLARIVGRSMREYYETDDDALVQLIMSNNEKLADWRAELPPFLSGTVKPSSLIPVLRRQATILKLFHLHTVIFINRPLLLKSFSDSWSSENDGQIQSSINACISAASEIAKQAVQFNLEGQAFRAFWFSQNMTFNAVSILYLNALRLLQDKTSLSKDEHALVSIANDAQKSLTDASESNAPGQRYGFVLEQLRLEVRAHLNDSAATNQTARVFPYDNERGQGFAGPKAINDDLEWGNMTTETPLNDATMFWPQFDGLPLSFDDWLGAEFGDPITDPIG